MNTRKKAIVSAVAGAALLAGTGATFALWQDSSDLDGGFDAITIHVGELNLANIASETNQVTLGTADDGTVAFRWVPGDWLTSTITIDLPAQADLVTYAGDNMVWELTFQPSGADATVDLFDSYTDDHGNVRVDGVQGVWVYNFSGILVDGVEWAEGWEFLGGETIEIDVALEFVHGDELPQVGTKDDVDVLGEFDGNLGTFTLVQVPHQNHARS